MVRVIMGAQGAGKTKQMIELINEAARNESGSVVCIEQGSKLTYDINYQIRLIDAQEYSLSDFDMLKGFLSGLHAGNYDISKVFIESLTKIAGCDPENPELEKFLDWLNAFGERNGIQFVVTISADVSLAPEGIRKYF